MAGVTLIYEDTDITADVDILECVCRDVSGGESDWVNLKVDHADRWIGWGPQKNDRIQIVRSGYDSKTLYLNTIVMEDGAYRIIATGAKCVPFPARWQTFEDKTLAAIMGQCAGELGMGARQYGISEAIRYEYMLRRNMIAPRFLETLLNREGAVLKSLNGDYVAIGIEYAQNIPAKHQIELSPAQLDSAYIDRRDSAWGAVQIKTPFGSGIARDRSAKGFTQVITDISVDNDAQAYRWAKGLLMLHNRGCELLRIESEFNPGYTAMGRIDVTSRADAEGEWIIHEVEHDMVDGVSRIVACRCVKDIA